MEVSYIPAPEIVFDEEKQFSFYKYEGLVVKETKHKGAGVFVEDGHVLKPGLRIPYGGICISRRQMESNYSHARRKNKPNCYTFQTRSTYYDAHPRLLKHMASPDGSSVPSHAWIGSLLNEPDSNAEEANCQFALAYDKKTKIYPLTKTPVFIQVIKQVQGGEELTLDYKYSNRMRVSYGIKSCYLKTKKNYKPTTDETYREIRRQNCKKMNENKKVKKAKANERNKKGNVRFLKKCNK